MADSRPVYLNLIKIRLPVTGMVSFAHRVSGAFLFLSLPVFAWLLDRSVSGEQGFAGVMNLLDTTIVKLLVMVLLWSVLHHVLAGIRFLLIDIDIGVLKTHSRASAWTVVGVEIAILLMLLGLWWLA